MIVPAGDLIALARAMSDVSQGKYDWSALRESAILRQARLFSDRSVAEGLAGAYRQALQIP